MKVWDQYKHIKCSDFVAWWNKLSTKRKLEWKKEKDKIVCFEFYEDCELSCEKNSCRYRINHINSQNCALIAASSGPKTLQEIGDIFGVTRMRICQIEKRAIKRLKTIANNIL